MPSRAWVVTVFVIHSSASSASFQCPHGLELLLSSTTQTTAVALFQCPHGLELLHNNSTSKIMDKLFQCPHGLELLPCSDSFSKGYPQCFNALTGLSCYSLPHRRSRALKSFQCPHGLELLRWNAPSSRSCIWCFNALTGLSCYGKNTQYFKFFMILFMHTCYL